MRHPQQTFGVNVVQVDDFPCLVEAVTTEADYDWLVENAGPGLHLVASRPWNTVVERSLRALGIGPGTVN